MILPVVAPEGTTATIEFIETELREACTPLKRTMFSAEIGLNPVPVNVTVEPGEPELFEIVFKFRTENFCIR